MSILNGSENLIYNNKSINYSVIDFWKWSSSDLLNNTLRGVFAEFIVAAALDIDLNNTRVEWDSYDMKYNNIKIEIKSSAYLQSWKQKSDSILRFSIRHTIAWDSITGRGNKTKRQSDMYIFCVFNEKDKTNANPLNLNKWDFYPVLTSELNKLFPLEKTIGIKNVQKLCPEPYDYSSLREGILWLISERRNSIEAYEPVETLGIKLTR